MRNKQSIIISFKKHSKMKTPSTNRIEKRVSVARVLKMSALVLTAALLAGNVHAQQPVMLENETPSQVPFAIQKNPVQVTPVKNVAAVAPGIPFCPTIAALDYIDYSYNRVILGWDNTLTFDSIFIRYALNGSTTWRDVTISGNPNPGMYMIEGLVAQTTYDFELSTKCHTGAISQWTPALTITTFAEPAPRLSVNQRNINQMRINPNPANTLTTISFSAPMNSTNQIIIASPAGREVYKTVEYCTDGKLQVTVDVSNITPGLYMVKVQNTQGISTERLIIQ
jgi:hypothetical protein